MGIPRSSYYHKSTRRIEEDEFLMQLIDRIFMDEPTYGTRRMRSALKRLGYLVGRDRIRRLMKEMGIFAIYPKPRLSISNNAHKKYPL